MEIKRAGTQPSAKGPSDWFTGTVRIDPLFQAPAPARRRLSGPRQPRAQQGANPGRDGNVART